MNAPNNRLRIALGQLDLLVGDVAGNARRIVEAAERACSELNTDLLVLPELTLSGYPPEDLLFHRGFRVQIEKGLQTVRSWFTEALRRCQSIGRNKRLGALPGAPSDGYHRRTFDDVTNSSYPFRGMNHVDLNRYGLTCR